MNHIVISRLVKETFVVWFSEPGEIRPANGRSLDGAVVVEIVYRLVIVENDIFMF